MDKVKYTLISILPMIGAYVLKLMSAMGLVLWDGVHGMDITNATKDIMYQSNISTRAAFVYAVAGVILFGFCYLFGTTQTRYEKMKPLFSGKTVIAVIAAGIGLQCMISGILNSIQNWKPLLLVSYQEKMQSSIITQWEWMPLACTIILAPIVEELVFRGITVHFLRKATYNFFLVNFFQALMFGFFHMNLVQGIYTFFMGLFFGYLYYKYGSLVISMVVHMILNATGILLSRHGAGITEKPVFLYVFTGVAVIMVFGAILLFSTDCPPLDAEGYSYDVSKTASRKTA